MISAVFVIFLSLSGILIHHSSRLGLDAQFTDSNWLLNWYGIEVQEIEVAYSADDSNIALLENSLYFNTAVLDGSYSQLAGMLQTEFGFLVLAQQQLLVLTPEGAVIETLGAVHGMPRAAQRLGKLPSANPVLETEDAVFIIDVENLDWLAFSGAIDEVLWSEPAVLDAMVDAEIKDAYATSLLSWERLMIDLHSGRIFGSLGVVLVDIMALLFVFMAITGIWIWSRRKN